MKSAILTMIFLLLTAFSVFAADSGMIAGPVVGETFEMPDLKKFQVGTTTDTREGKAYSTGDFAGAWRFYSTGTYSTLTSVSMGYFIVNSAGQITGSFLWEGGGSQYYYDATGTIEVLADGQIIATVSWPSTGASIVAAGQISADRISCSGIYFANTGFNGIINLLRL